MFAVAAITSAGLLGVVAQAQAATFTTIYRFSGGGSGESLYAGMIIDASGQLYGMTRTGGPNGRGIVFSLSGAATATQQLPATLTTIASFTEGSGGWSHMITDGAGNLYGTNNSARGTDGAFRGSIFKIDGGMTATPGAMTTLARMSSGRQPGPLVADAAGNLYGTTAQGGPSGLGTVFKIAGGLTHSPGPLQTLATFNGANGNGPFGELVLDKAGNLFGSTTAGGTSNLGTIFRISAVTSDTPGPLTTVLNLDGANAKQPTGGLISDGSGNLYGSGFGGPTNSGTVFKLSGAATASAASPATFTRLASFDYATTGQYLYGGLIADAEGNLFGTTLEGGANFLGTVFRIDHAFSATPGPLTVLATFNPGNAYNTMDRLVADAQGNLYGTAAEGVTGHSAIYRISDAGFVVPTTPVPEPGAWLLWLGGLGLLIGRRTLASTGLSPRMAAI